MNQCKQIFGLPSFSHVVRGASLSRSAGSNGRDHRKSRERVFTVSDNSEPKLCDKSYARLIADYAKANERRNSGAKCDSTGFFFKTPFDRLARVSSSLIRTRSGSPGSNLSTSSFSRSPMKFEKRRNSVKIGGLSETEILEDTSERAEFLDRIIRAHRQATRNNKFSTNSNDERTRSAPKTAKFDQSEHLKRDEEKLNSKNKENESDRMISKNKSNDSKIRNSPKIVRKINEDSSKAVINSQINESNFQNVSVLVRPLESEKSESSKKNVDDSKTFVVTVTEESEFPSTSENSPLRHIDLRINGEPATNVGTIITKMEKLDVVSLAERIEIKIPVATKNLGDPRISSSTINLSISSRGNEIQSGKNVEKSTENYYAKSRDTFYRTKSKNEIQSTSKNQPKVKNELNSKTTLSKFIPWWTTEESFRQSETKEMQRPLITRASRSKIKENAKQFLSSEEGTNLLERESNHSRERSRAKQKALSAISKMIENELRQNDERPREKVEIQKKSEILKKAKIKEKSEVRDINQEIKVKSSKSNELKKQKPSLVVGGAKSEQTLPKVERNSETFQKSKTNTKNVNHNLTKHFLDKPANVITKKSDEKIQNDVTKKEKSQSRLTRTYGKIKLLPSQSSESVTREKKSFPKENNEFERIKNAAAIKPIEKKKDGTLIDYGLTVPTRKNSERKSFARIATEGDKKLSKKDEPVVVATIKEIIPKRKKELPVNPGIIYPAKFKDKCPIDWKKHPYCQKSTKISNPIDKMGQTSSNSIVAKNRDSSPEKKLLYSVWLRHKKDGQDPNSSNNPNKNSSKS